MRHQCEWPNCTTDVAESNVFCRTKICREARQAAGLRGLTRDEYAAWGVWADKEKDRTRLKNQSEAGRLRTQKYRSSRRGRTKLKAQQKRRDTANRKQTSIKTRVLRDSKLKDVLIDASPELLRLIDEQARDQRQWIMKPERFVWTSLDKVVWVRDGEPLTLLSTVSSPELYPDLIEEIEETCRLSS